MNVPTDPGPDASTSPRCELTVAHRGAKGGEAGTFPSPETRACASGPAAPDRLPSRAQLYGTGDLQHGPGCTAGRVETYEVGSERPRLRPAPGYGVRMVPVVSRVTRCMDCGSQVTVLVQPPPPIEPGTAEFRWAWQYRPELLAELLTPAERADPTRNPLHPAAVHTLAPLSERARVEAAERAYYARREQR